MPAITSLPNKVPFNGVEITVSPFHQTRHLFDVSRCFVFTELIPILESWCHMVMRSCPLRCGVSFTILQKQQRTPSITEIVTKVPRLQGVKTMKLFQITKETTRRPAGTASAAGEEFHQTFHQIWRQTSCSSAGPHRTTNWWWGATGGREAVVRYWRASQNHPDSNNANNYFCFSGN